VSTSFAQTTSSPTVSYVYLGGRVSSPHTIHAFSLQANGSAHLVPGSPFSAAALNGSSGQTALAVSTNFVYASDTVNIATFRRSANGALTFAFSVVVPPDADGIDTLTLDRTASNLTNWVIASRVSEARLHSSMSCNRQALCRTTIISPWPVSRVDLGHNLTANGGWNYYQ